MPRSPTGDTTTSPGSCRNGCRACRRSGRSPASSGRDARPTPMTAAACRPTSHRRRPTCRSQTLRQPSGDGGSPVKSSATRRASTRRSASGAGVKPSASSRARMNWSIGLRTQAVSLDRRRFGTLCRHERPVRLVLGPFADPADQRLLLFLAQRLVRLGRRHAVFADPPPGSASTNRLSSGSPGTMAP